MSSEYFVPLYLSVYKGFTSIYQCVTTFGCHGNLFNTP